MRTPQIVLSPIGRNFPALAIPGTEQIRGVLIDNHSGSWLLLRPTHDYIPPYTIGWARSFMGGVASIDLVYESPSGQISTLQGDPAIVVLDTEMVPDAAGSTNGSAFIEKFTPAQATQMVSIGGSPGVITNATLLPAIANKRYRLRSMIAAIDALMLPAAVSTIGGPGTAGVGSTLTSLGRIAFVVTGDFGSPPLGMFIWQGVIQQADNPRMEILYDNGLDLAVGGQLTVNAQVRDAWFASGSIFVNYELV